MNNVSCLINKIKGYIRDHSTEPINVVKSVNMVDSRQDLTVNALKVDMKIKIKEMFARVLTGSVHNPRPTALKALVDTGDLGKSLMSFELAKHLNLKLNKCKFMVKTAEGSPVKIMGQTNFIKFHLEEKPELMEWDFLVVRDLVSPLILGMDFLTEFSARVTISKSAENWLHFGSNDFDKIPLTAPGAPNMPKDPRFSNARIFRQRGREARSAAAAAVAVLGWPGRPPDPPGGTAALGPPLRAAELPTATQAQQDGGQEDNRAGGMIQQKRVTLDPLRELTYLTDNNPNPAEFELRPEKQIRLPAGHRVWVPCRAPPHLKPSAAVLVDDELLQERPDRKRGVVVRPILNYVRKGRVAVLVENHSESSVRLNTNYQLATAYEMEEPEIDWARGTYSREQVLAALSGQQVEQWPTQEELDSRGKNSWWDPCRNQSQEARKQWVYDTFRLGESDYLSRDPELMEEVKNLLGDFTDVVAGQGHVEAIPRTDWVQLDLELIPGAAPVHQRPRRLSPPDEADLERQLVVWLKQGVIVPAVPNSFALNLVPVRKKGVAQSVRRWTIDARPINLLTCPRPEAIATIAGNLETLAGKDVFCQLDLANAFLSIPLRKEDIYKLSFVTPSFGNFSMTRSGYGLMNSPKALAKLGSAIMRPIPPSKGNVYMDDFLIFDPEQNNPKGLLATLGVFLSQLRKANVKLQASKCHIFATRVLYLGHLIVTKEDREAKEGKIQPGLHPDPELKSTILEAPLPQDAAGLRRFLGQITFFSSFLENLSELLAPLHKAKGVVPFLMDENCCRAFEEAKKKLFDSPALSFIDFKDMTKNPLCVMGDYSKEACNFNLYQFHSKEAMDQALKLVGAAGKTNRGPALNWSASRGEAACLEGALNKWSHLLMRFPWFYIGDSFSLKYVQSAKDPTGYYSRLATRLSQHDCRIIHRPGTVGVVEDCWSRQKHHPHWTDAEISRLQDGEGSSDEEAPPAVPDRPIPRLSSVMGDDKKGRPIELHNCHIIEIDPEFVWDPPQRLVWRGAGGSRWPVAMTSPCACPVHPCSAHPLQPAVQYTPPPRQLLPRLGAHSGMQLTEEDTGGMVVAAHVHRGAEAPTGGGREPVRISVEDRKRRAVQGMREASEKLSRSEGRQALQDARERKAWGRIAQVWEEQAEAVSRAREQTEQPAAGGKEAGSQSGERPPLASPRTDQRAAAAAPQRGAVGTPAWLCCSSASPGVEVALKQLGARHPGVAGSLAAMEQRQREEDYFDYYYPCPKERYEAMVEELHREEVEEEDVGIHPLLLNELSNENGENDSPPWLSSGSESEESEVVGRAQRKRRKEWRKGRPGGPSLQGWTGHGKCPGYGVWDERDTVPQACACLEDTRHSGVDQVQAVDNREQARHLSSINKERAQDQCPIISAVRQWVLRGEKPSRKDILASSDMKALYNMYEHLHVLEGVLYIEKLHGIGGEDHTFRWVVPRHQIKNTLVKAHDQGGLHMRLAATLGRLENVAWWPNMHRDVTDHLAACPACQVKQPPPGPHTQLFHAPLIQTSLGETAFYDIIGPLTQARSGEKYILTCMDGFSRYCEAWALKDRTATTMLSRLREYSARHGCPKAFFNDNDTAMKSKEMDEGLFKMGAQRRLSLPFVARQNKVERAHKVIGSLFKTVLTQSEDYAGWTDYLPEVLRVYNSATSSVTKFTPNRLMLGREIAGPLSLWISPPQNLSALRTGGELILKPRKETVAESMVRRAREIALTELLAINNQRLYLRRQASLYQIGRPIWMPKVGDECFHFCPAVTKMEPEGGGKKKSVVRKFSVAWTGPWVITEHKSELTFIIKTGDNKKSRLATADRLHPYVKGHDFKAVPAEDALDTDAPLLRQHLADNFAQEIPLNEWSVPAANHRCAGMGTAPPPLPAAASEWGQVPGEEGDWDPIEELLPGLPDLHIGEQEGPRGAGDPGAGAAGGPEQGGAREERSLPAGPPQQPLSEEQPAEQEPRSRQAKKWKLRVRAEDPRLMATRRLQEARSASRERSASRRRTGASSPRIQEEEKGEREKKPGGDW